MTNEEMRTKFVTWIKEIVRWGRLDWFVRTDYETFDEDKYRLRVAIFTHHHKYTIVCVNHSSGKTYLGCTVSIRKPRAGEDWNRGNDLPDGMFCRETWESIKNAIVQYELVKIAKSCEHLSDEISIDEFNKNDESAAGKTPESDTTEKMSTQLKLFFGLCGCSDNGTLYTPSGKPITTLPPRIAFKIHSFLNDNFAYTGMNGQRLIWR